VIEPVWAGTYDIIATRLEERARRDDLAKLSTVSMRGLVDSSIYDAQQEQRLVRLVDEARAVADRQNVETRAAREARSMISRPPGLAAGLVVLALLTAATVVVPLLFLAPTPATLSYGGGVAIVALFLAAVVLLFGYMVSHVYRIRTLSSDRNRQPSGTGG
jgi:sterol desaturase/sphingolipid hydroxylase (fatty acid hydroxylase superfamily)